MTAATFMSASLTFCPASLRTQGVVPPITAASWRLFYGYCARVEGLGNLAGFILTGGNIHDSTEAQALLDKVAGQTDGQIATVTADKAYDSAAIVAKIEELGGKAVIPQFSNRKVARPVDWAQYKNRNIVERFFARLKQFHRIATRYDKLAARFASFVHLAAALIWLA